MRLIKMTSSPQSPVYVVGDVHGMIEHLDILLKGIRHYESLSGTKGRFLFLGDLVDKGPDSLCVMDTVLNLIQTRKGSHLILGNHDERFLDFVRGKLDERYSRHWLTRLGGTKTLRSYARGAKLKISEFPGAILTKYQEHIALLETAVDMVLIDDMCAVHAGINPEVPLLEQSERDLRWIRWGFLDHDEAFERRVIHGHSPNDSDRAEEYFNRVSLDAGAAYGGRLAAAILTGPNMIEYVEAALLGETYEIRCVPRHARVSDLGHPIWLDPVDWDQADWQEQGDRHNPMLGCDLSAWDDRRVA